MDMGKGVGLVETKYITVASHPHELTLESGQHFGPVEVAYETYGELNQRGDNCIIVPHALTGEAHVAGRHTPEDRVAGWWDELIGPGRALDTNKYFVVAANVIGGCCGTTGPKSTNPETGKPYGADFPLITIRDMVQVQYLLLKNLGIRRIKAVIGGSMGGMQVLEWALMYPEMVEAIVPIAASGRLAAQCIAFNAVQREAITGDSDFKGGHYYPGPGPIRGMGLARQIATITYKSDESWASKFGRTFSSIRPQDYYSLDNRFEVEHYLDYQGEKLVQRFDANTYLYLTKAMDLHDLGRGRGEYREVFSRFRGKVLSIGVSSDFLYPKYYQEEIHHFFKQAGADSHYWELISPYGHDAFLIEFKKMSLKIAQFMQTLS
ncbi:homoserine O-acetyltransferase [Metallumcola ferriviriculae]|uniref:Homoserine O-acetyltransferase n=1 Tax=Metallumcola ferriviriculae TaxID=3039180 RepID=A0AAU0UNR8_9FIRM|nr:homoserine O-acetyltransferase [Desulfitibacteraceae bacterium MK1]